MSLLGKVFKWGCTVKDSFRDIGLKFPADVDAKCNIRYVEGSRGKYNLLDVYRAKDISGKLPVIVNVHGGGYVYGKKELYKHYGMFMAQQGFVFVSHNYHLAPRRKFPTQLIETNTVMEWIVNNADAYNMDISNMFLVGDSAGAQMASHYAAIYSNPAYAAAFPFTVPPEINIRAIALNCGIYDFPSDDKPLKSSHAKVGLSVAPFIRDYLGKDLKPLDKMLHITENITKDFPPAFVMTGEYDFLKSQAYPMYETLLGKGVPCEYKLYGKKGDKHVAHIFHANMHLAEAAECNLTECAFFRSHTV